MKYLLVLLCASLCVSSSLACSGSSGTQKSADTTPTTSPQPPSNSSLIDLSRPAGAQLSWLLAFFAVDAPAPSADALHSLEHFTPLFLERMPETALLENFQQVQQQVIHLSASRLLIEHDYEMTVLAMSKDQTPWVVSVSVSRQPPYLIEGLFLQPAPDESDESSEQLTKVD